MRELALVLLSCGSAYLVILGIVALLDRDRAFRFFRLFAQTRRANAIEALCRLALGLAFLRLALELPAPLAFTIFGGILAVSAAAMIVLPESHKRFADRVVPPIKRVMPLVGVVALVGGLCLAAILWPLLSGQQSPY